MQEIFLVGIGGILGSLSRFYMRKLMPSRSKSAISPGTLFVNLTGAVLLGIVSTLHTERNIYVFTADGFLGAYTTFSTFMYEGLSSIKNNRKASAAAYIIVSIVLGISGFIGGTYIAGII